MSLMPARLLYSIIHIRCPSRACPNPDVVKPAWEKPDKDKGDCEDDGGGPIARNKRNNLKRRRRPRSKVKEADEVATTAVVSAAVAAVDSTVMNRTSSLLRDALLGGPRAADSSGQRRLQLVQRPRQEQPPSLHHQASSAEGGQRQVIVMLTPAYSTLPTSIALPQTPVPLSQLTAATTTSNNNNNNDSIHDNQISNKGVGTLNSVSSMTPPFSSGSSSTSTTRDNDDIMDDLMNIDDSMLFEMMDPKRLSEVADTRDLPGKSALSDSPLTLPLLDQSDDPCLNEGDSLSFVTDELDETVQKWMETCEGNFLPI